jgi:hypothetical protein
MTAVDAARECMLRPGFAPVNPEGMTIPGCVKTAGEAIAILKERCARWQDLVARPSDGPAGRD